MHHWGLKVLVQIVYWLAWQDPVLVKNYVARLIGDPGGQTLLILIGKRGGECCIHLMLSLRGVERVRFR